MNAYAGQTSADAITGRDDRVIVVEWQWYRLTYEVLARRHGDTEWTRLEGFELAPLLARASGIVEGIEE